MKKVAVVVGGILYTLSPLDLIPDVIPVIGWLDDVGVIAFVIGYLNRAKEAAAERRLPRARPVDD